MVSDEFLNKTLGKSVHIDYWDNLEKEVCEEDGIMINTYHDLDAHDTVLEIETVLGHILA